MTSDDLDTEYGRYAATRKGAIELAAAAATAEVSRLFHWLPRASSRKQKEISRDLEVTEGRISQVLNGDGNVTVAALAKYLRAYGYRLKFQVSPADEGVPEVPANRRRPARRAPAATLVVSGFGQLAIRVNAHDRSTRFIQAAAERPTEWIVNA